MGLFDFDESKGKKGISYGLGLKIFNLQGENQELVFGGIYGNENLYFLKFSDPWIFGNHISININLYQFSNNKFCFINNLKYSYKYNINGFKIGSGFNIKNYTKFKFEIGFNKNTLTPDSLVTYNFEFSEYQNIEFGSNYIYDSRNIYNDPTNGLLFNIGLKLNY